MILSTKVLNLIGVLGIASFSLGVVEANDEYDDTLQQALFLVQLIKSDFSLLRSQNENDVKETSTENEMNSTCALRSDDFNSTSAIEETEVTANGVSSTSPVWMPSSTPATPPSSAPNRPPTFPTVITPPWPVMMTQYANWPPMMSYSPPPGPSPQNFPDENNRFPYRFNRRRMNPDYYYFENYRRLNNPADDLRNAPVTSQVQTTTSISSEQSQATTLHVEDSTAASTSIPTTLGQSSSSILPTTDSVKQSILPRADSVNQSILPTVNSVNQSTLPTTNSVNQSILPTVNAVDQSTLPTVNSVNQSILPTDNFVSQSILPTANFDNQSILPSVNSVNQSILRTVDSVNHSILPTVNSVNQSIIPTANSVDQSILPTPKADFVDQSILQTVDSTKLTFLTTIGKSVVSKMKSKSTKLKKKKHKKSRKRSRHRSRTRLSGPIRDMAMLISNRKKKPHHLRQHKITTESHTKDVEMSQVTTGQEKELSVTNTEDNFRNSTGHRGKLLTVQQKHRKVTTTTMKIFLRGSSRLPIPLSENNAFCHFHPGNALCGGL